MTGELTYRATDNIKALHLQALWASIGIYRSINKTYGITEYVYEPNDYNWRRGQNAHGADGSYIAVFNDLEIYIMAKLAT